MNSRRAVMASVFVGVSLLALGAGYLVSTWRQAPSVIGVGDSVPAFSLPDTHGVEHTLENFEGKTLLINFWASWCAPCREEIPLFAQLQDKYAERGFQIVGIAIDDPDKARQFGDDFGINYPSLIAETEGMSMLSSYGNPGSLPFSLLVDTDGVIQETKLGKYREAELEASLKKLL